MWKAIMRKPHSRFLALIVVVAACSRPATKDEAVSAYAMNKGKAYPPTRATPASLRARGWAYVRLESSQQQPAPMTPVGIWRGTSVCLVRPSACHDEIVVYYIARTKAVDSMTVDARKIVRGEEQGMGVLDCRFTSPNGPLICAIPQGTWQFTIRKDSLVGELRLPDNTKFRDVKAVRSR
jgi:hypothetical protein